MPRTKKISKFLSETPDETRNVARELARSLKPGDVLYLYGELGSGKTVFVKGLCESLGVNDDVTSPSFVIATEYHGKYVIAHVDLYRLDGNAVTDLPIEEYILEKGITVIEWADRIRRVAQGIIVKMSILNHHKRTIEIEDLRD
ncbi:MAG: tRNA (adenosine(37)-N6)-threonylcarbamoyltransferase complex ATPase subunit type 1 TsaE [candidate division WOR-3 bacterium]|nr:tRNA (adenosine(37)-N6)-threonylcarbamoyltransferase complex ATPase subunit type 1 TsaE [candidate division WOR-3 bacterium]